MALLDSDGTVIKQDSFRNGAFYFEGITGLFFQPDGDLFIGGYEIESGYLKDANAMVMDLNFQVLSTKTWSGGNPFLLNFRKDRLGGVWVYFYDGYNLPPFYDLIHLDGQLNETYHGFINFILGPGYDFNMSVDKDGNVWKYARGSTQIYLWKRGIDGVLKVNTSISDQGANSAAWSITTNIEGGLYLAAADSSVIVVIKVDSLGNFMGSIRDTVEGELWSGRPSIRSGADSSVYIGLRAEDNNYTDEYQYIIKFNSDMTHGGQLKYERREGGYGQPYFNFAWETDSSVYFVRNSYSPDGDSSQLVKVCLVEDCNVVPEPPDTTTHAPTTVVFRIWPNPTTDAVFMKIPEDMEPELVRIWDLNGKLVLEKPLAAMDIDFEIDVNGLRPACYIYELYLKEEVMRYRLVKVN